MGKWRSFGEAASVVAIVTVSIVIGAFILMNWSVLRQRAELAAVEATKTRITPPRRPQPVPNAPVSLAGAIVKGSPLAKVAVISYSDVQCPYCGRFAQQTQPKLEANYVATGLVQFAFRHRPIQQIHPPAVKAAEAMECAGREGRFWEMHDRLFQSPAALTDADLSKHGTALSVDPVEFTACLSGAASEKVRQDMKHADELDIRSTPTFLIGRVQADGMVKVAHRLAGAVPYEELRAVLDPLIQTAAGAQK